MPDSNETATAPQQNYIGGKWVDAVAGKTFSRNNPYDQSLVGVYQDSDEVDAENAVEAAREAFDFGPWPRMPATERAAILRKAAALLRERADLLAQTMTRELGQPHQRKTVLNEAEQLEYYAGLIVSRRDDAVYAQRDDALGIVGKEPVGVVAALTSWNVPLSIVHKALPGIAAGCTVVAKPPHLTSGVVLQLAQLLEDAGLPAGVFNVVTSATDNGALVGQALVSSPRVDMVTFTGSSATGPHIVRAAAGNMKKMNIELGGKSPHVIFADAPDLERAAFAAAKGFIRLAGQSCQCGSRLLIQESVKDEFLPLLLQKVAELKLGDPFDDKMACGPLISEDQLRKVESYVELGKVEAKLLIGGNRPAAEELSRGFFFEPTVFDDVSPDSRLAQEEIFGPVLSILTFTDLDDAIRLANHSEFGLAAGCWTRDLNTAMRFAREVRSGVVWVNSYRDDVVLKHMPMGAGYKQSGIGREWGPEGLDAFLETKAIMINLF
jgi:acyl-CoA reductase-like NAD-dependent aldehyde dehydrogenase